MKKGKKIVALVTSVALIAAIGIGSTLAYLTSKTDTVTNTFTVGSYADDALKLYENPVEQNTTTGDYTKLNDTEVHRNDYANVLPGTTLFKDPTITLKDGSPESYLFLQVTGLDALASAGITPTTKNYGNASPSTNNFWKQLSATGDVTIFVYCPAGDGLPGLTNGTTKALFTELTVDGNANTMGSWSATKTLSNLVVKGCAVQYGSAMGTGDAAVTAALAAADFGETTASTTSTSPSGIG